ncbi:DJ-1/PfpI family protein [Oceanivirga salmonicida]|uniref:DJ-1/PfpI family protein n=1 Tax=Oceanivirga salmonicida TaxID=1769291 RepID=UPI0008330EDC|nr:DJ-1/PfpI family protein [Oceanivirga salmonicida]
MNKKIALLIYHEFSFQEIANLSALFRWYYDTLTVTFSTSKDIIKSEEGFLIVPNKTVDEFNIKEYDCLILPGCSDLRISLRDDKITDFLKTFNGNNDFIIGAICAGPVFLSKAGLLKDKNFINSLYFEMNTKFKFINEKNIVYKPIVVDGNIITAVGEAYKEFAIQVARKLGYYCSDDAYAGISNEYKKEDFIFYLENDGLKEFEDEFSDLF